MRYLPFILLFALIVYALVDCVRYEDSRMPVGLPKAIWVILIVVFPVAGAAAWLVVSRVTARAAAGGGGSAGYAPPPQARRPRPTRPVAPDDDPEFLASLGRPIPEPEAAPEPDEPGPAGRAKAEERTEDGQPAHSDDRAADDGPADTDSRTEDSRHADSDERTEN